jgi:hypothetical protein
VDERFAKKLVKTVRGIGFVIREDSDVQLLRERRLKQGEW